MPVNKFDFPYGAPVRRSILGLSLCVFAFACSGIASRCEAAEGDARVSFREIHFNDAGVPARISATLHLPPEEHSCAQIVVMERDGPLTNCGGAIKPDRSEPGKLSTWNITFDLDHYGPALGISSEDMADWKLLGMEAGRMALQEGQTLVPIVIFKDFLVCISVSALFAEDPLLKEWVEHGKIPGFEPDGRDRERDKNKTEGIPAPSEEAVVPHQSSESAPAVKTGSAPKVPRSSG